VKLPARGTAACLLLLLYGATAARAGKELVDPTRPSTTVAAPDDSAVHVQAIISRAGARIAIVAGHLVRAGDRIANILIEEVTPDGVRYSQNGHSAFARLSVVTVAVRRPPTLGNHVP
jgi:hypothetical protein